MCSGKTLTILLICNFFFSSADLHEDDSEEIFFHLVPEDYDRNVQPPNGPTGSFLVQCIFNPASVTTISIKTMDITIDVGLIFTWIDPRLNATGISPKMKLPNMAVSQLWYPRLIMGDCKSCKGKTYIKSADPSVFINSDTKEVAVHLKKKTTITCRFNMSSYPFDVQLCSLKLVCTQVFRCFNVNIQHHIDSFLNINQIYMPPGYALQNVDVMPCETTMFTPETTCVGFFLKIKRGRVRPILVIFMPSMLLVVISWISFWLDVQAAAPRVALGLTVMLTLSTHFNAVQRDLPAVSTIMAVDVWMFSCIFIVFASLVEFAIVHFCNRGSSSERTLSIPKIPCFKNVSCKTQNKREKSSPTIGIKLDVISRILFPLLFIIFNLTFWIHYCY